MATQQASPWQRGLTMLHGLTGRKQGSGASTRIERPPQPHALRVTEVVTVDCSPENAYRFWRDPRNLPRFMSRLESADPIDERRSRWLVQTPGGVIVACTVDVTEDRPNELLAFRTHAGSRMVASWSVHFAPAPGERGTEVRVDVQHEPPGSVLAATIAKLFGGVAERRLESDLRRFKQVMETGEVVRSEPDARVPARSMYPVHVNGGAR